MENLLLRINRYLLKLGFVPNIKGSIYLREALKIIIEKDRLCNLKTEVYPFICQKYKTTAENVEKNISNAIDRVWLHSDIEVLYADFGYAIDEYRGKPTVKEFLAHAHYKISQHEQEEDIIKSG